MAALKKSISEAEQRVGQSAEQLREEISKREYAEKEKAEWERRGREFEDVLRKVREGAMEAEKEVSLLPFQTSRSPMPIREILAIFVLQSPGFGQY